MYMLMVTVREEFKIGQMYQNAIESVCLEPASNVIN